MSVNDLEGDRNNLGNDIRILEHDAFDSVILKSIGACFSSLSNSRLDSGPILACNITQSVYY